MLVTYWFSWQEWRDSNPQPPVLETGALTKLSYTPSVAARSRTVLLSRIRWPAQPRWVSAPDKVDDRNALALDE